MMGTCDMGYEHDHASAPEPAEIVVEDKSAEAVAEEETDAAVKIAQIEAERAVKVEQLWTKQRDQDLEVENARLLAENEVLRAKAMPPEPEPIPVPVPVPDPEPEPEPGPPPPPEQEPNEPPKETKGGWWAGYS